ncbi:MAG: uroporphyrinogen decarboxylase family protein [Kiritimatiellae bacterium]|nr:uroporphyrinogen decarboxylase family protein [Verrucomicrobiota bacterium]MCG2660437.1 uroporphyrinogen decarboxylase family protein [Kiritimatiellia bacterium]
MPKFDIPETPWDLIAQQRNGWRKLWNRDFSLETPLLQVGWKWEGGFKIGSETLPEGWSCFSDSARRINDPEFDVRCQLEQARHQIEELNASRELGIATTNTPFFDLIHFGTGPLATAFGASFIVREGAQPFFEPAVHSPAEAMKLKKPDLFHDGICPQILDRIQYYNTATQGKVILTPCDTAGPWSIATQIWHYEDILEAILSAPQAVHYVLNLITDAMLEWFTIQEAYIGRWGGTHTSFSRPWIPRGAGVGDDCLVTVSPRIWEEFFLPYNNRISREYGGMLYHCCMKYETHFDSLIKTEGFIGFDPSPEFNDFEKIASTLERCRGVWTRQISHKDPNCLNYVRRLKGKVGMFFGVGGNNREEAIKEAREFMAILRSI